MKQARLFTFAFPMELSGGTQAAPHTYGKHSLRLGNQEVNTFIKF